MSVSIARAAGGAVGVVVAVVVFTKRSEAPRPAASNTVKAAIDDADIAAARKKARETLPRFWASLKAPVQGDKKFMVKVAFDEPGKPTEVMWVEDPTCASNGDCLGRLANKPENLTTVKIGQATRFSEAAISDWMFMRKGKIAGAETVRALVKYMPKDEAAATLAQME